MSNKLIEILQKYAIERPESPALMMDGGKNRISYAELDRLSGCVYAALKERSVGREDMVMIFLPRGVEVFVCMLGIIKAGAAFTILEDTSPIERKDVIARDSNCRLVIDIQLYNDLLSVESISGYEEPNLDDACFAVYTSGSTGTPKGVLHEYGKIEYNLLASPIIRLSGNKDEMCACVSPLNFIAAISLYFSCLEAGGCALIVDYKFIKNQEAFQNYLVRNKVTHIILTPSLLKNIKQFPSSVRQIFIGGERATGLYIDGIEIINNYTLSEAGMDVCTFSVDRPYALTPVGKNRYGIDKIFLLDENGQETARGEICFKNPYCRGYIGLPELNRVAFRDGLYHSGDEGYFNENGDLVVCGRIDDMLKIRGNRVEPGEVEEAVKKVLHTDTAVVKGFCQNEREFLVAYACGEEKDRNQIKADLRNILPEYMIPTFYVFLDKFPTLPNGKIDKKALAVPEMASADSAKEAPQNEVESYLCHLFEDSLSVETVGRCDDYFDIGGDSLTAMKMISECKLKRVSMKDLYELRTPARIADRIRSHEMPDESIERRRIEAMQEVQPALVETQVVFDFQNYALRSTMWNLSFLFQMKDGISVERLQAAVDRVLKHHPVFSSVFVARSGRLFQQYRPEMYEGIKVVYTTEAEFSGIQGGLVRYYEPLLDALLYRKAIYVTEKRTLLFFDIHHSITDGSSLQLVMKQIVECYQTPETVLPPDYYYLILEDSYRQILEYQNVGNDVNRHYREILSKYINDDRFVIPVLLDEDGHSRKRCVLRTSTGFSKKEVQSFIKKHSLTENVFFSTACLLAIAKYNKSDKSMLLFVHSGHDDAMRASSCGLLFHDIPLFLDLEGERSIPALLNDIKAQEEYGVIHGAFNISYLLDDSCHQALSFIYQKDMLYTGQYDLTDRSIDLDFPDAANILMEFSVIDNEDEKDYGISVVYSSSNYKEESIKRLAGLFEDSVNDLLALRES